MSWRLARIPVLVLALVLAAGLAAPTVRADAGEPATGSQNPAQPTAAKKKKEKEKKGKGGEDGDEKDGEEKKKDEAKPFDEVIEKMQKVEGLFTFYRDPDENKVLIEILPEQLDRDFIYSAKIEQATGERGLYGTIMMDDFVFQWHKMGKTVQFVQQNTRFRAAAGSPAARAIESSFSDSVLASAKVASKPHPERGSILVDLGEIFLASDFHDIGSYLKQVYETGYSFDKDNSSFVMVKSFPLNSEIGTEARFTTDTVEQLSVTIPDPRSLNLRFRYSLVALPEDGYMPRLADDRVGYFMDQYLDYTSDEPDTPYVRYVSRWKLEKEDPEAELSEPVGPIVFWLESSIPVEYRDFFRQGVELWNPAFERIGFKDALVVKQQPDDADWDPADIRYNTIRWFVAYDASFAIGPSHTNPYTGQILDADIGFSEAIIRLGARRRYQLNVDPVTRLRRLAEGSPPLFRGPDRDPRDLCSYADGLVERASMALDVMAGRPGWSSEEEREFVRQFIVEVTAHEVGHTLGLRHNFRASTINRLDQLADPERSRTVGLGASVMDYNPPVVAAPGEPQGEYFPQVVGSYDQWAIEYGYKPIPGAATPEEELDELRRIARQGADPLHPYATDEDAGLSARALDPRNSRFDFSADPIEWFRHELQLVDELWSNMEEELLEDGESYNVLRRAFGYSWSPYFRGSLVAMKYIGGIYHHRDHVGDPGGRIPYVPVPAEEQQRALEFLASEVWSAESFAVPADLLRQLQFERFWDFEFSIFSAERLDYPLHDLVAMVQSLPLEGLYHPIKLSRLQDAELLYEEGQEAFTLSDLFTGVREAIWSELASGEPIHSFRRNLQRAHLDRLVRLVLAPPPGTPEDAVSLARADLVALGEGIERSLGRDLGAVERAHLEETRARIEQVLAAQVHRGGSLFPALAGDEQAHR